jgi:hypothetical protein
MRCPLTGLAAAALTLCSSNAFADAYASASLSDFRVQLFDLDLGDNITPSVTFQPVIGSTALSFSCGSSQPEQCVSEYRYSGSMFGAIDARSSLAPLASGNASLAGDPYAGTAIIRTAAEVHPSSFAEAEGAIYLATLGVDTPVPFTLSPNTRMMIFGTADTSVVTTVPQYTEAGEALVDLRIRSWGANTLTTEAELRSLVGLGSGTTHDETGHGDLEISFTNPLGSVANGDFYGEVRAYVNSSATVVPEPAAAGLMLAGLAALAALERRRRVR